MTSFDRITKLSALLEELYKKHSKELLFHGWHHITFVRTKAVMFASYINANSEIVEASALTHDLNYIIQPNSEPDIAKEMRSGYLREAGFDDEEIAKIESVVMQSHMRTRSNLISPEGMALSDADTLFKALPTTPILFASKYITQNKVDILKLATKVTTEQQLLMDSGIYFYIEPVKENYLKWAQTNLQLWSYVLESLDDDDVNDLLMNAKKFGVL